VADAMGIGSCTVVSFANIAVSEAVKFLENITIYILVTRGYSTENPAPPPRLPFATIASRNEHWKEW
jgi:nitroreductase